MAPRPLPQSWSSPSPPNHSTLQWHPTMAPSNGTTSTATCNGTLGPRPIRQSGSSPSPPIGSQNPYSYRYLGKKRNVKITLNFNLFHSRIYAQNWCDLLKKTIASTTGDTLETPNLNLQTRTAGATEMRKGQARKGQLFT